MATRQIIFLSLPTNIFGNGGQVWTTIDLSHARSLLESRGFQITDSTIDQLDSLEVVSSDILVYSSCEAPEIREYMKDAFYFLKDRCTLVPSFDHLLAYENKGFQELKKRILGIGDLRGRYHYDLDTIFLKTPIVFKTISGAGSKGVRLIKGEKDFKKVKKEHFRVSLFRKAVMMQRKFVLRQNQYAAYKYRHKGFRRHILQEFISNITNDYKILVFGNRYFGLKRYVKAGDFRASGSGIFDFSAEIPYEVLDYAEYLAERLDAPQLSLDIAMSEKGCHLIEYQALNFGPTTLTLSNFHYERGSEPRSWVRKFGRTDLGECFGYSLLEYFDKHGINP